MSGSVELKHLNRILWTKGAYDEYVDINEDMYDSGYVQFIFGMKNSSSNDKYSGINSFGKKASSVKKGFEMRVPDEVTLASASSKMVFGTIEYGRVYDRVMEYFKTNRPFEYHFLQKVKVISTELVETACSYYDTIRKKFVIEYNPKFIEKLAKAVYVGNNKIYDYMGVSRLTHYEYTTYVVLMHEVQHIIRAHCTGCEDIKNMNIANLCYDLAINNSLKFERDKHGVSGFVELGIGVNGFFPITATAKKDIKLNSVMKIFKDHDVLRACPGNGFYFKRGVKYDMFILSNTVSKEKNLYDAIMEMCDKYFILDESGSGIGGASFDEGYQGDANADGFSGSTSIPSRQAITEIVDTSLDETESEGKEAVAKMGRGVSASIRNLDRTYSTKRRDTESWRALLRNYLAKGLSSKEEYQINSPNARIEGQFGRDVDVPTIKTLALAIDVSGSMSVSDYKWCLDEVDSIVTALKSKVKIKVIWWGSRTLVEDYSSFKKFMDNSNHAPSLGGTYFEYAIDELNKCRADVQIVLTDGQFWRTPNFPKRKTFVAITPNGSTEAASTVKNCIAVKFDNK